jgi:hypothetical protein
MHREGPALEALLHRLSETPQDFLEEPRIGTAGRVAVAAVAADLCRMLGGAPTSAQLAPLAAGQASERNRLAVALILCWLLADAHFRAHPPDAPALLELLGAGAGELAAATPSRKFVEHPERREELARFALARLGLRPLGETPAQAQDRLTSLSAAERRRVLAAARAAEERASAIREALRRKAAEESADKWTRD